MSSLRVCTIILICVLCVVTESAVLISDIGMHRMIELNSKRPFCKSHVDRWLKHEISTLRSINQTVYRFFSHITVSIGWQIGFVFKIKYTKEATFKEWFWHRIRDVFGMCHWRWSTLWKENVKKLAAYNQKFKGAYHSFIRERNGVDQVTFCSMNSICMFHSQSSIYFSVILWR